MLLTDHVQHLWNGGLNPETSTLSELRERRLVSATVVLVILVSLAIMLVNGYAGAERDNPYIATGIFGGILALYVQSYSSQQLMAAQIPIVAFWLVICLSLMTVGLSNNSWAWLLCLPVAATLLSGRVAGLIWTLLCLVTIWLLALQHQRGYYFSFAPEIEGFQPLLVATEISLVMLFLAGATFFFRDTQIETEQGLNKAVRKLEREVQDRAVAESEARETQQAQTAFLAAISHDLRTPLNGVIGASQMLADGDLPRRKQELIDVILQSSETLLQLINNVMDMNRLDESSMRFEAVSIDLRDLAKAALAPMSFQARVKDVGFDLQVEEDVPKYLIGDPLRMRQVLMNLTGNAVKFTDKGDVRVIIDTALERIRIKVIDSGIGISKEAQTSLFDPYVQAEASTVRKYGGSGLGLTIVNKLVDAMRGKVVINSSVGQGTTFTVFLPLEETERPPPEKTIDDDVKLPRLSVVVADDDSINRFLLIRLLEEDGHIAVAVSNGLDAVEYLKEKAVNVVLMDLEMPVMDGLTATKNIRAMDGDKAQTPIIGVTAHAVVEEPDFLISEGMNAFVTKPYRPSEVRRVLYDVLKATGLLESGDEDVDEKHRA